MASIYYGETDRTRGVLVYSTDNSSATSYTITAKTQLEAKSYGYSGYRVTVTIGGDTSKTKLSYVPGVYTSWHFAFETDNASKTISKTHASQTVVISSDYKGEGTGSYYAGGKSGSTTYTVTIPAKTSYAVTYNANGGSGGATSQTKWYDEPLTISSSAPTRTGYTFAGWNTKADGTGTNYTAGATYSTNAALSLYAKWTVKTYSITYNGNDSTSGSTSSQTKTYGSDLTLRSNGYNKTGYTFVKWNTKADGTGTSYNAGATYTANAAATLYAIWTKNTYTVSYNANGGTGAPASQTKTYGVNLTLSSTAPTRTGYTFLGWSTSSTATSATWTAGGTYSTNASNILYAVWQIITYSITYNGNGNTGGSTASQTKNYGASVTLRSNGFTYTGKTFSAWNTKANGSGTAYNAGTTYSTNANLTLYAQWATITYSVTYAANGGSGAPGTGSKTYGVAYTISSTVPTRTGYNFTGWLCSANSQTYQAGGSVPSTVNQNFTLTAQWATKTYTITYNKGSYGTGSNQTDTKTYGTAKTLKGAIFTRSGYTQSGWSKSDGGTKTYNLSASYTTEASVTLYPFWSTSYWSPKIYYQTEGTIPRITRTNETQMTVAFNWAVYSSTSNTVAVAYKAAGGSSYTTLWTASRSATSGSESQTLSPSGGFDNTKTYDIRISVYDGTNTSYYYGFLSSGFFVMNVSAAAKGKAIGIGQAPATSSIPSNGRADFGMDAHFNNTAYLGNNNMKYTTHQHLVSGAQLSTAGWYRIANWNIGASTNASGSTGFLVDVLVASQYQGATNCIHKISLLGAWNKIAWVDESSATNTNVVNRIRYTTDTSGNGHIDIYYNSTTSNNVRVDLASHFALAFNIAGFTSVGLEVPANETVRADYGFYANYNEHKDRYFMPGDTFSALCGMSGYCDTGSTSITLRYQAPKLISGTTATLNSLTGRIRHVNGGYADGVTGDWLTESGVTVTMTKNESTNEFIFTLTKTETFKRSSTSTTAITANTPVFATMTPNISFT